VFCFRDIIFYSVLLVGLFLSLCPRICRVPNITSTCLHRERKDMGIRGWSPTTIMLHHTTTGAIMSIISFLPLTCTAMRRLARESLDRMTTTRIKDDQGKTPARMGIRKIRRIRKEPNRKASNLEAKNKHNRRLESKSIDGETYDLLQYPHPFRKRLVRLAMAWPSRHDRGLGPGDPSIRLSICRGLEWRACRYGGLLTDPVNRPEGIFSH